MLLRQAAAPPLSRIERPVVGVRGGANTATRSRLASRSSEKGTVLFDADCRFCVSVAKGLRPRLRKAGFALTPLQAQRGQHRPAVPQGGASLSDEAFDSMVVLTPGGRALKSAEALLYLAERICWARPVAAIAKLPFGMRALEGAYAWVARNRFCLTGKCVAPVSRRWPAWLPLLLLLAAAFAIREQTEDWLWMWVLSFSVFFGLKWSVWWNSRVGSADASWERHVAYLCAWVGMDAVAFLSSKNPPSESSWKSWARGSANVAAGAALVWGVVPIIPLEQPSIRAWTGLIGLILVLHFGLFHLLAVGWQTRGVDAQPIMRSPLRSTSLSEFWGRRWNLGFRYLSHRYVFQPLRPRLGTAAATVAAFLASGAIHDLVISLPARGGYGLPTVYFALQAAGVLIERSALGNQMGLGSRWTGRAFATAVAAGPVMLLFHQPFIVNVALPMLQAMGAF